MAKTLSQPVVAVDLKGVVSSAVENVTAVRRMRAIELETTFQKLVADGLSYEDQVRFLEDRIAQEQQSSFGSKDLVAELQGRIAQTKKLMRFNKYRTTYSEILAELKAGRANAKEQLAQMQGLLNGAGDDEELRLEILGDIQAMEQEVKAMEDTMIQNQLKKAQYDGTEKELTKALDLVKGKRAKAVMEGLDDEASAYDTWITVLNKQLSETRVSNALTDVDVRVNTKGMGATQKLDELNQLIRKADGNTPITIDNVTYDSAKEFWTFTRDSYLAGTGTGIFGDFFKEIDAEYTLALNAAVRRDGFATTLTLDRVQSDFADLKNRTELQPFIERAGSYEALVLGSAIESTAKSILDRASVTGDYIGADATLQSYAKKYGINVDQYRLSLATEKETRIARIAEATGETPEQVSNRLGMENILSPDDPNFKIPTPAALKPTSTTPEGKVTSPFASAANYSGGSIVDFLRAAGQASDFNTRAKLAAERGITNYTGTAAQNNQLLSALRAEATAPPPVNPKEEPEPTRGGINAPEDTPGVTTKKDTKKEQQPSKKTTPEPASKNASPTATPTPTKTPEPKPQKVEQPKQSSYNSSYQGGSIVDFLKSSGQASDYASRQKLAAEQGITNYVGSAEQNTALLKKLRGF
jgi:hypothetical protein